MVSHPVLMFVDGWMFMIKSLRFTTTVHVVSFVCVNERHGEKERPEIFNRGQGYFRCFFMSNE